MLSQRQKKKPKRLGTVVPIPVPTPKEGTKVENAKRERRERVIDLSKYSIGFDEVKDKSKRKQPKPSQSQSQSALYERYLAKFEKGELNKFSTRDLMFFFRDTANDNNVKYIIGNAKVEMRNFKLALERGYSNEDLLAMIEFLFTSGQTYLDKQTLHPGVLLTGWCNRIYNDTQLWLEDKYDPNKDTKMFNKKQTTTREWTDNNTEVKSQVGEWE